LMLLRRVLLSLSLSLMVQQRTSIPAGALREVQHAGLVQGTTEALEGGRGLLLWLLWLLLLLLLQPRLLLL
jgi:hypothetical protein